MAVAHITGRPGQKLLATSTGALPQIRRRRRDKSGCSWNGAGPGNFSSQARDDKLGKGLRLKTGQADATPPFGRLDHVVETVVPMSCPVPGRTQATVPRGTTRDSASWRQPPRASEAA